MRAYVPIGWPQLEALRSASRIPGPVRAVVVDPTWRTGAPEVDEEEWEFEAQSAAAAALGVEGGVVLAVDADVPVTPPDDGWVALGGPLALRDVAAVLDAGLAWFGVQELEQLLAGR
jgi:hypothetical protein